MKKVTRLVLIFWLIYLLSIIPYSETAAQETPEQDQPLADDQSQSARNEFSLGISPPIVEINATVPAKPEANITIENASNEQQPLSIIIKPFRTSVTSDGSVRNFSINDIQTPEQNISKNIKIYDQEGEISSILLEPYEARTLRMVIDVNENIESGDYYFSVIFASQEKNDSRTTLTAGGIGTNVILSVNNDVRPSGEIVAFSVPSIITSGPVPITLLVRNNGPRYFMPTGNIRIKNMFGNDVARIELLPEYILANSERYLRDLQQASESGEISTMLSRLSVKRPIIIWTEKFVLGLYSVEANIDLSPSGPHFTRNISFLAVPLYLVFGISFIFFILLSILIKAKRKTTKIR